MNINRDNYEEFFILYGDNELAGEDRLRVQAFVQENPDLASEFAMLNQARFAPDENISFGHKEDLLEHGAGQLLPHQELMLLSLDNELTAEGRAQLNGLLERNAALRAELEDYTRTRFDPNERIVFPYKESLYRKEEKARVIPFAWRRIAAAAAILVAVSVTAFIVFNKEEPVRNLANSSPAITVETQTDSLADNGAGNKNTYLVQDTQQEVTAQEKVNTHDGAADRQEEKTGVPDQVENKDRVRQNEAAPRIREKQSSRKETVTPAGQHSGAPVTRQEDLAKANNNLPTPISNPNVTNVAPQKDIIASTDKPVPQTNLPSKQINPVTTVTPGADDPLQYTVIRSADPDDETADQGSSSRKNKLRGFFRKVTRTFEKTTNIKATDEEDRLLLGGLAIRL